MRYDSLGASYRDRIYWCHARGAGAHRRNIETRRMEARTHRNDPGVKTMRVIYLVLITAVALLALLLAAVAALRA
jgi:hypothetical protein